MSTGVRRGLYGRLAGDTTLNALLGAPANGFAKAIYYRKAPRDADFPCVIFAKQTGTPTEAFGDPAALRSDVWLVKGVDQDGSADTAEAIQARLIALLNDASLSISGAVLCYLRQQSDIEYGETVDGAQYQHAGGLFRLVTSST